MALKSNQQHITGAQPIREFFSNFKYHYAVLSLIPLIAGIVLFKFYQEKSFFLVISVLSLVLSFYLIGTYLGEITRRALFWLLAMFIGVLLSWHTGYVANHTGYESFFNKEETSLEGVVVTEPFIRNQISNMELGEVTINRLHINGNLIVKLAIDSGTAINYGDKLQIQGRIRKPPGARNPGAFNYAEYLGCRGIYATMNQYSADKIKVLAHGYGNPVMDKIILPLRKYIRQTADQFIGNESYLVIGILLGEKRDLPESVLDDFRSTGLMHLLAVSGLNVGMLILIFYLVFGILFVPYRSKILLTILMVWLYAIVTDLSPSVVRASIMGSVILFGWMFERKAFIYNSLAFSAILILVVQPLYLYDIGFQLSYIATLAIVYLYPRFKEMIPWKPRNIILKSAMESLVLSVSAMAGTIPIIAYTFNNIAPVSIAANLIAVPISFALLGLGLLVTAFGFVPFIAYSFGASAYYLTLLLNKSASFFAKVPGGYLETASPDITAIIFFYVLLVCFAELKEKKWARKGIVFALLIMTGFYEVKAFIVEKPIAKITFLDVGQGDCAVIEFENGKVFLIDGGAKDRYVDNGLRVIAPYFKHIGIRRLDGVFSSHPDDDHLGGLLYVMEHINIAQLFDTGTGWEGPLYAKYIELVNTKNIPRKILEAGERVLIDKDIWFDVLSPQKDVKGLSVNEMSMVLRLDAGGHSILFTGDIGFDAERIISYSIDSLKSEIIKVAHHGAKTSSSEDFIDRVAPQEAVISVGQYNRFGHPDPETLERFRARSISIYRTDLSGAIEIRIYKNRNEINTMSDS